MRIALTGGGGIIGRNIKSIFPQNEYRDFNGRVENLEEVKEFCEGLKDFDCFLHLAAVVPRYKVEGNPSYAVSVNSIATENIMRELSHHGSRAPWIFYSSSSHVYASKKTALKEDDPTQPITIYGQTKLLGEEHVLRYAADFDLRVAIGRIFSYSDVDQSNDYFIPAMAKLINNAEKNQKLVIPGINGTRDFLRVSQICQTIFTLAEKKFTGVVNIGSGHATLLANLVFQIRDKSNRSDIRIEALAGEDICHFSDTTKLKQLDINIENQIDILIDEIVRKYAPA
jgi:nucleoside-diphosphate-sugar epimerase